jgi:hypothetical protein
LSRRSGSSSKGELPDLEQRPGFKGVLVMVDRDEGKAAAMMFWESLHDLTASDKIADRARQAAIASARPRRRADRGPMRGRAPEVGGVVDRAGAGVSQQRPEVAESRVSDHASNTTSTRDMGRLIGCPRERQ